MTYSSNRILCLKGSDQTANRRPEPMATPAIPGLRSHPLSTSLLALASLQA